MIKYCDLSATYMPTKAFNGLEPFKEGLGWLPLGCPVVCIEDIEISGSGGGGSSYWKDSAKVRVGNTITLIRRGNPGTAARVKIEG